MSKIFYIDWRKMTHEEKWTWVFLSTAIIAFIAYCIWLTSQSSSTPLTEIAYVSPMLLAIGSAIISTIFGEILIAATAPKGKKRDARDQEIIKEAEHSGQFLVTIGGMAVVIMAMLKLNHFWIAHTMYLAFVGSAIITSVVKIIYYKKGFYPC